MTNFIIKKYGNKHYSQTIYYKYHSNLIRIKKKLKTEPSSIKSNLNYIIKYYNQITNRSEKEQIYYYIHKNINEIYDENKNNIYSESMLFYIKMNILSNIIA